MPAPAHDQPHDRLAKFAFGRPAGARALLALALPEPLASALDLDSLRVLPSNVVGAHLREGFADLLFSVQRSGDPVLIHILVEHKSAPHRFTVLDLFESCGRIWRAWRNQHPAAPRVPPIVPVVLHHGPGGWTGPKTLGELLDGGESLARALAPLQPSLPIVLVDLAAHADSDFDAVAARDALAGAALWMLRWSRAADFYARLVERADLLERVLRAAGGGQGFEQLIHYAWSVVGDIIDAEAAATRLAERLSEDAERIMKTIADQLIERGMKKGMERGIEQGMERGMERGIEQGIEQGRVLAQQADIRAILAARFGPLSGDLESALARCTEPAALAHLVAAAATAATLADFERGLSK